MDFRSLLSSNQHRLAEEFRRKVLPTDHSFLLETGVGKTERSDDEQGTDGSPGTKKPRLSDMISAVESLPFDVFAQFVIQDPFANSGMPHNRHPLLEKLRDAMQMQDFFKTAVHSCFRNITKLPSDMQPPTRVPPQYTAVLTQYGTVVAENWIWRLFLLRIFDIILSFKIAHQPQTVWTYDANTSDLPDPSITNCRAATKQLIMIDGKNGYVLGEENNDKLFVTVEIASENASFGRNIYRVKIPDYVSRELTFGTIERNEDTSSLDVAVNVTNKTIYALKSEPESIFENTIGQRVLLVNASFRANISKPNLITRGDQTVIRFPIQWTAYPEAILRPDLIDDNVIKRICFHSISSDRPYQVPERHRLADIITRREDYS